jgi:glycerophosphoryl diester phosphodiesterase
MGDLAWLTARPIAHRGLHDGNKAVWENTLTAFSRAVKGNFAIECDVLLSRDGAPMVLHDSDLKRLTGTEGKVSAMTAELLTALKVGGTADALPTLRQMLEIVQGRVPLVIELKGDPGHDSGLVRAVAAELAAYSGKAAIMSFDHHLLRQCAEDAPGIALGLTAEGLRDQEIEGHFSMLACGIDFVSYNIHDLPNRFVTFARQRLGMPVISWTVRNEAALRKTYAQADQATFEGFDPSDVQFG